MPNFKNKQKSDFKIYCSLLPHKMNWNYINIKKNKQTDICILKIRWHLKYGHRLVILITNEKLFILTKYQGGKLKTCIQIITQASMAYGHPGKRQSFGKKTEQRKNLHDTCCYHLAKFS